MKTYFAILIRLPSRKLMGYALDAYADERAAYLDDLRRSAGTEVLGEFPTYEEAMEAVRAAMTPRERMH